MVKPKILLLLFVPVLLLLASPASAQDYSRFDMMFGYGNYGIQTIEGSMLANDRVSGFLIHTDIGLANWLTFENITGLYGTPDNLTEPFGFTDNVTLIANTFGIKLLAREVLDGRITPYVAGGMGVGYWSAERAGGVSGMSARYAGGVDINLSDGFAWRIEGGGLTLSKSIYDGAVLNNMEIEGWQNDFQFTTGIVLRLGF
jgi:hypothetical protein